VLLQSADGSDVGEPRVVGSFHTPPSQAAPNPLAGLRISPIVGPDRFIIEAVGQDKPGFVHIIITRPSIQGTKLLPGTATNFTRMATSATQRRRRLVQQSSNLTALAPDAGGGGFTAGTTFFPSCPAALPCDTAVANAAFAPASSGAVVVHSECLPVQRITEEHTVLVASPALANDTLYRVLMVTTDLAGYQDGWSALVRTQDLTPPRLKVVEAPPPEFTSFDLIVALNEPGMVFASLQLAAEQTNVGALPVAQCPPTFDDVR